MISEKHDAGIEARMFAPQENPVYQITLDSSEKKAYIEKLYAVKDQFADEVAFIKPGITDPERFQLQYILVELAINAAEHGNKYCENSKVNIALYEREGKLSFVVKDQGKGFDAAGLILPVETRETRLTEDGTVPASNGNDSNIAPAASKIDYDMLEDRGRGISILSISEIVEGYYVREGRGEVRVDLKL
jgi:anti-sigma regulatory factor (Ser/Thr protein kinase)